MSELETPAPAETAEPQRSRRADAKVTKPAAGPDAPKSRRWLKVLVILVLGLLWIRVVLFSWVFPLLERYVDNPELNDTESSAPEDPSGG